MPLIEALGSTYAWRAQGAEVLAGVEPLAGRIPFVSAVTGDVLELHRGDLRVLLNCGTTEVPLPEGTVLASSRSVTDVLPPDTCVWLG